MANTIALITKYAPILDEVYGTEVLTSDLDGDISLTRAGANANEIAILKIQLAGLADYGRNTGYVSGDIDATYETVKFNFDRGRKFSLDAMDNEETGGEVYLSVMSEFERTRVAPEVDAFRFARYASLAGLYASAATLSDGSAFLAALLVATTAMDEAEVPQEGRILYATPTLVASVMALDTTKSREVLASFSKIKKVPQSRFYTAIDQYNGTTSGEEDGGYVKDAAGLDINFMIIQPKSVLQYTKHKVALAAPADANFDADALTWRYRLYQLCDAYDNKIKGIYRHNKAT